METISDAINKGMEILGTQFDPVQPELFDEVNRQYYKKLDGNSCAAEHIKILGEYVWENHRFVIYLSSKEGLLQKKSDADHTLVLSKGLIAEEIFIALATQSLSSLSDSFVSDRPFESDGNKPPDGIDCDFPSFGASGGPVLQNETPYR